MRVNRENWEPGDWPGGSDRQGCKNRSASMLAGLFLGLSVVLRAWRR